MHSSGAMRAEAGGVACGSVILPRTADSRQPTAGSQTCYPFLHLAQVGDICMTVQAASSSSVERELELRKKLSVITNQINSAESIPQILMTLKDKILELLDAERLTIYAVDTKNQELYSITKVGDVPKEIRVPKSFASIAGFTALARKTINIKDAYEAAELAKFHPNLRFDQRWDKQTGFRTKSLLGVPIMFEKY